MIIFFRETFSTPRGHSSSLGVHQAKVQNRFYYFSMKRLGHHYRYINKPSFREPCCSVRMLKTKIVALLGLMLTLASLLLGSRTLGYQRAVFSLQLGGLFLVLGGFFRLYDNHPLQEALASLYDLEDN